MSFTIHIIFVINENTKVIIDQRSGVHHLCIATDSNIKSKFNFDLGFIGITSIILSFIIFTAACISILINISHYYSPKELSNGDVWFMSIAVELIYMGIAVISPIVGSDVDGW